MKRIGNSKRGFYINRIDACFGNYNHYRLDDRGLNDRDQRFIYDYI